MKELKTKRIKTDSMKKILIATQKPFAPAAIPLMEKIAENAGHEVVLLENYADENASLQM